MVSVLQVAIALIAVAIVAAIAAGAVYYSVLKPAPPPVPRPPVPPIPGEETINVEFYNGLSQPVIVIRINGNATDNKGWTDWPIVPGTDPAKRTVIAPHASGPDYKTLQPGETGTFPALTAGAAGSGYIVRVNCDPTSRICDMGDSVYVQDLDGPTFADRYRDKTPAGIVPFKPAIDTRVEFTWGCAYQQANLCGVNPSHITSPSPEITTLMAKHPFAKFSTNGLLYEPGPNNTQVNVLLEPPNGVALGRDTFFDISCVDGFTVPMILQVRRPTGGVSTGASCALRDGSPLDAATGTWQTLANTSHLASLTGSCPSSEILWPSSRIIASLTGHVGDGFNAHSGTGQFPMPWVTQATSGAPAGTKLLAAFTPNAPVDLHMYRNPQELTAAPHMGWSVNNLIGCASPCSILTKDSGTSQMYPKPANTSPSWPAGHYATGTYLAVGQTPFVTTDRGVSEVCCQPAPGADPVIDSNKQCNTSTWWADPGIGPALPTAAVVQYNFGFYVNMFAPSPGSAQDQPWWSGTGSINPYSAYPPVNLPPKDQYVDAIRNGANGQVQTTRAYSYAHDDAWNTLVCGSIVPSSAPDPRGATYKRYDVRVTIGTTPPS